MEKPFIIYRSSAGSGKTYTLAREYLKLALRQPTAYRSILAVTFTNKATQEMKGRVLQYLHEVAKADASAFRTTLADELDLSETELSLLGEEVLQHLLHGYSYFSVMTIDAFFQKVVRGFAREMGLQAGFRIELDLHRVLDEVIDRLLLEIGNKENRNIRRWLTRFAEEKVEAGLSWDFRREIKELALELFKEDYREKVIATSDSLNTQTADSLLQQLRELQSAFENRMAEIGRAGLKVMAQKQVNVSDFSYGKNGVAGYFNKIIDGTQFIPSTRVLNARGNPEAWVKKTDPRRDYLLTVAEQLISPLEEALEAYEEYGPLYHSVIQMQRFMYTYGMLNHLEAEIDRHKRENDLMLISDAPVFLKNIIGQDDTPFIYEKIGTYYQHFLIDEFQDTSGLQWMNFRPLVENSLDAGNQNLVVGDVKQSIYRWRGGDWQLLLNTIQQDMQEWRTEIRQLDHNFRSRKNILEFNNALFQSASELLYKIISEELEHISEPSLLQKLSDQTAVLSQAYTDVTQKLPDSYHNLNRWHGHVRIELLNEDLCLDEAGQPIGWRSYVCARLPAMIESLQDQGYAARDIAFLVRNKRDGQDIVDTLMQYKHEGKTKEHYNYEVISSESLMLSSSVTVSLLVELMRFLDNPQDAIVRSGILYKYFRLLDKAEPDGMHDIFSSSDDEEAQDDFFDQLPADFKIYHPYLNKLPIYELVENLVLIFDLGQHQEKAYLQAFQDTVLQYSLTEQGDLQSFLSWWDERGANNSAQISEETDAMRVMTIHKAKGLQFKVVLLPFCDWSLDHQPLKTNILWTYPSDDSLANIGLIPMKYSSQLTKTVFQQDYYQEKIRVHMDHLNLLYVAFTRAEEALYAFARPQAKSKGKFPVNNVANLLREILPTLEVESADSLAGWDEMAQLYEAGNFPPNQETTTTESHVVQIPDYSSTRWRNRLSVRPLSQGFFSLPIGGVSHVALMQQLLTQLPSAKQLDSQLEKMAFERGLTAQEQKVLRQQTNQFLSANNTEVWYQPEQRVLIQRPLLIKKNWSVVLDRVILADDKAVVINFVTQLDEAEKRKSLATSKQYLQNSYSEVKLYLVDVNNLKVSQLD